MGMEMVSVKVTVRMKVKVGGRMMVRVFMVLG